MAQWNAVQNIIDGQIQKVVAARQEQGLWYWREAIRRAIQDFREVGTVKVYPLTAGSASADIDVEAVGVRLFGILLENSLGSDLWVQFFNTATPTLGTTVPIITVKAPTVTARGIAWLIPEIFTTALTWAVTTTPAGATQTGGASMNVCIVYTK
jgi:hypothetical protein